jgi:hypothetical protein
LKQTDISKMILAMERAEKQVLEEVEIFEQ